MTTQNNAAAATMQQTLPPEAQLMQMVMGCFVSQAVSVAARLGIADLVRDNPKSVRELAEATETHERSLYRLLRSLASVGVFAETEEKVFALSPLAEPLLSNRAGSVRDAAIFIGADWHWSVYSAMMHSVKTGEAAWKQVHGAEAFPYFRQNPDEYEIFNRAMSSFSAMAMPVVEAANNENVFDGAKTLVDIAGGHGTLLAGFLRANPQLEGILFDLPEVITGAPEYLEKENIGERVEIVSGDFFESVPENCDVYMMKHIIHDWDDERAVKILKNIARAMNADGKVLIVELVIPTGNTPHAGKIMDLEMLVSPGGVERTEAEYRELLAQAGLKLVRVIPSQSPLSIVEAVKN